jgi:hypothetical protein
MVLKAMKWNGREIRNGMTMCSNTAPFGLRLLTFFREALQTAIALAPNDAEVMRIAGGKPALVEVTADHLEQVVERRKVFIEYTNSIRRETEEQRALGEGSRRDRELR